MKNRVIVTAAFVDKTTTNVVSKVKNEVTGIDTDGVKTFATNIGQGLK